VVSPPVLLAIQHAGPKLSGYATSSTTTTTVAQNATPGFLRFGVIIGTHAGHQGVKSIPSAGPPPQSSTPENTKSFSSVAYQRTANNKGPGPSRAAHAIGVKASGTTFTRKLGTSRPLWTWADPCPHFGSIDSENQQAGPKLATYSTGSPTTTANV